MSSNEIINKTMDFQDLETSEAKEIVAELNELILCLRKKGLKISSWYGRFDLSGHSHTPEQINRGYGYLALDGAVDDQHFPWFLYWEIAWVVLNNNFAEYQRVLDLGGSSSLFSYYLASKGLNVTTVELQEKLVENANVTAQHMNWNLKNYVLDMRELSFAWQFDHITSLCVYEHIPMYDRIEINRRIKDLLVNGGCFSITFDYRNPSKHAQIASPGDLYEQFIEPSGLRVRGNELFADNGRNYLLYPFYHPEISFRYRLWQVLRGHCDLSDFYKTKTANDYTFGALFMQKSSRS